MKKLGLVIVDGVGYRNFILSNFLYKASKEFDKVIIYSGLIKQAYNLEKFKNVEVKELDVYIENKKVWFWRKLNETAHLYRFQKFYGMRDTLEFTRPKGYSRRAILNRFIRVIAFWFNNNRNFNFYQKKIYKSFSKHKVTVSYIKILKEDKPNVLFFTHQRPPYIAPLVYAANKCGIPTTSFIFSWDNLSSKGRIPAVFDFFMVWSNLMKQELLFFYPNIKKNNVNVVGTPQFEPYIMDKYSFSRSDFVQKFKVKPKLKTICFSCGDLSTGGNDILAINIIASAILNNRLIENVNLVVRTSPADNGERFKHLKEKYPFIIWNYPKWYQSRQVHPEPWSQRIPTEEDIKELRALVEFSDLSINMCSTMSLDFMIFDKPVINQVLGNETNGLFNDQRFLNYTHYKKVVESNAVSIVKNREQLIKAINQELKHPKLKSKERKRLIDIQISEKLENTSDRICSILKKN